VFCALLAILRYSWCDDTRKTDRYACKIKMNVYGLKRLPQCEKMTAPTSMKRCRANIFLREVSSGWISPRCHIDRSLNCCSFFYAKTSNCECFRSHDSNLSITSHYIDAKLSNFEFIPMRKNYIIKYSLGIWEREWSLQIFVGIFTIKRVLFLAK